MAPEYLALVRRYGVATVFADSDKYPSFADASGDFVYARLMLTESRHETGYPRERDRASGPTRARDWAHGGEADGLPRVEAAGRAEPQPRDVFMFFISGAKERAPAAAVATLEALLAELGCQPLADALSARKRPRGCRSSARGLAASS